MEPIVCIGFQFILMTYDHHDNTSAPGPVSPHAWVVNALKHALSAGVPANKIVLGVNDYGYDWNTSAKTAITIPQKVATTAPASEKSYNPVTKEVKVAYTKNGKQHIAYYGGRQALADKVAIAKQNKLYGIAIWKVGYENQAYWQELLKVNGDAASLQAGATNSTAPSAAYTHKKKGAKPITHRPIGTKSGRAGTKGKGTATHSGTSRSQSGTKRGTK
ncbi:MAG: glycosyl hydrolase family 18 protein [Thermaerobacter sp.]|nr:glycosyl hydrolase family 18 protein [Thermaerobacter sp.]